MGNVLQAGLGQNSARQASLKAGLPIEVPASIKALVKAGLTVKDLDLIAANEAFAAQFLAVRGVGV